MTIPDQRLSGNTSGADFPNSQANTPLDQQLGENTVNFKIHPDVEAILPPHDPEVYHLFKSQIEKDGEVRDPLVIAQVGGEFLLADGHNRCRIANELGLALKTKVKQFSSMDELFDWVIQNQLARRNFTDLQRDYYSGKLYLSSKKNRIDNIFPPNGHNVHSEGTTAEVIAKKFGVSEKTVRRNARFAAAVDKVGEDNPELKKQILCGKSGLTKQEAIDLAFPPEPPKDVECASKSDIPENNWQSFDEEGYDPFAHGAQECEQISPEDQIRQMEDKLEEMGLDVDRGAIDIPLDEPPKDGGRLICGVCRRQEKPDPNCKKCKRLNDRASQPKREREPGEDDKGISGLKREKKSEKDVFKWKVFDDAHTTATRQVGNLCRAYVGTDKKGYLRGDDDYREIDKLLSQVFNKTAAYYEKLTGQKAPGF